MSPLPPDPGSDDFGSEDLGPGDPVPRFIARTGLKPQFHFDTAAGRYLVLCFFGSTAHAESRALIDLLRGAHRRLFDDRRMAFFGITTDPGDVSAGRVADSLPGIRFFHDFDGAVSSLFGAVAQSGAETRRFTLVVDPALRVLARIPLDTAATHAARLAACLQSLPPVDDYAGTVLHAPVLILPNLFEPELCRDLIAHHQQFGGGDSGFMREVDGRTVGIIDHSFKRRADMLIENEALKGAILRRLVRRLNPELLRAFQFEATRIERYLIACYDSRSGGYFRPHRDNATRGTAHRQFAVTINLNAEDYEGGDLRFPEFGSRTYRVPTGGAIAFSCSLLHEALPVTSGRRYAVLPFLYDDARALVRRRNAVHVGAAAEDETGREPLREMPD